MSADGSFRRRRRSAGDGAPETGRGLAGRGARQIARVQAGCGIGGPAFLLTVLVTYDNISWSAGGSLLAGGRRPRIGSWSSYYDGSIWNHFAGTSGAG